MSILDVASEAAVAASLRRSLADLLRQRLEGFRVADIVIYPGADHDGDPVIQVEIKHGLIDRPIEFQPVFEADRAARDLAWERGERRFVHIRHLWDENQKVAGAK